jgi:hypothetical protein
LTKVLNQSKERWQTAVKSAEIWSQKGKTDRKKGGFNQHERRRPFLKIKRKPTAFKQYLTNERRNPIERKDNTGQPSAET